MCTSKLVTLEEEKGKKKKKAYQTLSDLFQFLHYSTVPESEGEGYVYF